MRIIHLITTYNEAENVSKLIPKLQKFYLKHPKYDFFTLFVDDSTDTTPDIILQAQKHDRRLKIILGKHQGLGAAAIQGYKYALKKLRPDVIVTNEADFAYDHTQITTMIAKIKQGYDVVVASRHMPGSNTQGWTISRRLNHWVANTFFATWIAGGNYTTDHNGEFRAIRVKGVLDRIRWTNFPTGFAFFNYLLFRLHLLTPKFYEFPITYRFRTAGESKISFNYRYAKKYFQNVWEYACVCIEIRAKVK